MLDAATILCRCAAERDPKIWPEDALHLGLDVLERWAELRIVREGEPLGTIHCPVCRAQYDRRLTELLKAADSRQDHFGYTEDPARDWCWADVVLHRLDGVVVRAVARCPRDGRTVEITPNLVRLWEVDIAVLAAATATALGTSGRLRELEPGRLFHLGAEAGPRRRDVFLMRGLAWEGAEHILNTAGHSAGGFSRVVGVMVGAADPDLTAARSSEVIPLRDVLQWTSAGFTKRGGDPPSPSPAVTQAVVVADAPTGLRPIPVPAGTKWEDIHVRVGEKRLCARIQGERHWRQFAEAGFADRRREEGSGEVTALWKVLMNFADGGSRATSTAGARRQERDRPTSPSPDMSREQMSRLRPILQRLFPSVLSARIDPIVAVRKGRDRDADNRGAYRPRFQIAPLPDPCFETPDNMTWSDLSLHLERHVLGDAIHIAVRVPLADDSADASGDRLPGPQGEEIFPLSEVVAAEVSEELLARLLREGVIKEPSGSPTVLELRRDLARFFDLDPDGIAFDRRRAGWVPRFGIK